MGIAMSKESRCMTASNFLYSKSFPNITSQHPCGCRGAALGSKAPGPGMDRSEDKLSGTSFGLAFLRTILVPFSPYLCMGF